MVDFVALVTPPILVGPNGEPAQGKIYAHTTNTFALPGVLVVPYSAQGLIKDGVFTKLGGLPYLLPVTPEGGAIELVAEIFQDVPGGQRTKHYIRRTVATPNASTVTWDALTDVVPVAEGGDYVLPSWAASLDAKASEAIAAAEKVALDRVATETAAAEAAAFGGTNNTQVAGMVTVDGPTKTALSATIGTQVAASVVTATPGAMFTTATDPNSDFAMRQAAQLASSASQIILSTELAPIAGSTNLATFQPITGATFSFVAPVSGVVDVSIQCGYTLPVGTSSLEMILRKDGVEVANTRRRIERAVSLANQKQGTLTYRTRLSGLIGGTAYSYNVAIRNADAGTIVAIAADTGGTWGPMTVQVMSLPAPVVSDTGTYIRLSATTLAPWTAAKAAVSAGTRDAKILCIGDSTQAGYLLDGPGERLATKLAARGLPATLGGTHPRLNSGSNPRYTAGAGWPSGKNYGFGSQSWQYNNPTGALAYSDASVSADSFDVYFVRGGGSTSITLQIDAETPQTFDATGTTGIGKLSITSLTPGASTAHALKITTVGTGAVVFVEPWLSTAKRIRVANAGVPSTNSVTWNNGSGIYSKSAIVAYQPDVIICLLGANDAISGYDAATVLANISGLAGAVPTAAFIVVSSIPCETLSEAALQKQYATRSRYATGLPFIDLNRHFGDWATANAAGWMSDIRHPNAAGMEQQAILYDAALALA